MKRRTKGDGALFKRGDGYWIGRVELPTTDGKRRWKTVSSKDRNTCIQKLKKLRGEIDAGRIPVTGNTTVQRWLDRWLEEIHGPHLRPTSKRDYAMTIRLYITPVVGSKRLDRLTPEHVREMHRAAQKTSTRAAEKAHVILKRALEDAVKEGLISRNVAAVARKPKHSAEEREALTAGEAAAVIRAARAKGDSSRWAAAFLTGARQGELLGLRWEDVDLDKREIIFSWQLQQLQKQHGCGAAVDGNYPCGRNSRPGYCPQAQWNFPPAFDCTPLHNSLALTKPKTKAGRRKVKISPELWVLLKQHQQDIGLNRHNLVWHTEKGDPIRPRDDHREWARLLKDAGIPHVPLHVARHTAATLYNALGMPEHRRMALMGHSSVLAQRGYAHEDVSDTEDAMKALDALLELN